MGAGIAEVAARSGLTVALYDQSSDLAAAGRERVRQSIAKAVERGKANPAETESVLGRITVAQSLDVAAGAPLVVEAVVEDPAVKGELFAELDRLAPDTTILASNTSSIPIMQLGVATGRPDRVVGLHFFNPVPVMRLVEVVPSLATSDETLAAVTAFATGLGKQVVRAPDRAGFIVNALLIPYIIDAIRFFEQGLATAADIDVAMVHGANHPMGPLALADLIGNDTVLAVAESLHRELADARHAPPPGLRRMVEAGRLGRKTGAGFFTY